MNRHPFIIFLTPILILFIIASLYCTPIQANGEAWNDLPRHMRGRITFYRSEGNLTLLFSFHTKEVYRKLAGAKWGEVRKQITEILQLTKQKKPGRKFLMVYVKSNGVNDFSPQKIFFTQGVDRYQPSSEDWGFLKLNTNSKFSEGKIRRGNPLFGLVMIPKAIQVDKPFELHYKTSKDSLSTKGAQFGFFSECSGRIGTVERKFSWEGKSLTLSLSRKNICKSQQANIPRIESSPHQSPQALTEAVRWEVDDKWMEKLFEEINRNVNGYYEVADNTIHFVQDIVTYTGETPDYWQTPYETLNTKMGDCEDGAILLASLLRAGGYQVALGTHPGHAFVWVKVSPKWVDKVESGVLNKCPLLDIWEIAKSQEESYAMAETAIDPNLSTLGYWGLGCGSIPQKYWDQGEVKLFLLD